MKKKLIVLGVILGALAIILGAFGAHALKTALGDEKVATFETGVKYQFYHAFFLLIISQFSFMKNNALKIIYYCVLFGVLFFSGSIYLLATNTLTSFDFKVIGFITPVGGLILIFAWLYLLMKCLKQQSL